jgi:riboflavin kinase/FMN adenylyltransferase
MTILTWKDLLARQAPLDRAVRLTVGVFDGIHLGHRRLLGEIVRGDDDLLPLVITFSRSPLVVHSPGEFSGSILTYRQKMERIGSLGVGACVVIDFSEEMSNLSGEAFVRLLRENLTIQRIVVGKNFRFGKKRNSGTDDLKEMLSETGIELLVSEPVLYDGTMVSSSRIRAAIRGGQLEKARQMLAEPHAIDLRGIAGRSPEGSLLRIPRNEITQVLPPPGEYRVRTESPDSGAAGTCRIDSDSLTIAAENCGGATMVYFS